MDCRPNIRIRDGGYIHPLEEYERPFREDPPTPPSVDRELIVGLGWAMVLIASWALPWCLLAWMWWGS